MSGNPPLAIPGPITPIAIVLFFLVIGEEIGWRGFLLPGLLLQRSPIVATVIGPGIAWLVWHSPLYFVPGMPSYEQSFVAFAAWVIPLSFLLTSIWLFTKSVWLATIMHGTANVGASLVFPVEDPATLFSTAAPARRRRPRAGGRIVVAVLSASPTGANSHRGSAPQLSHHAPSSSRSHVRLRPRPA